MIERHATSRSRGPNQRRRSTCRREGRRRVRRRRAARTVDTGDIRRRHLRRRSAIRLRGPTPRTTEQQELSNVGPANSLCSTAFVRLPSRREPESTRFAYEKKSRHPRNRGAGIECRRTKRRQKTLWSPTATRRNVFDRDAPNSGGATSSNGDHGRSSGLRIVLLAAPSPCGKQTPSELARRCEWLGTSGKLTTNHAGKSPRRRSTFPRSTCGVRPRLQRRVRGGIAPPSLLPGTRRAPAIATYSLVNVGSG